MTQTQLDRTSSYGVTWVKVVHGGPRAEIGDSARIRQLPRTGANIVTSSQEHKRYGRCHRMECQQSLFTNFIAVLIEAGGP